MKFASRLKELRVSNGFTQEEVAQSLNINRSTYAKYETGEVEMCFQTAIRFTDNRLFLKETWEVILDYCQEIRRFPNSLLEECIEVIEEELENNELGQGERFFRALLGLFHIEAKNRQQNKELISINSH